MTRVAAGSRLPWAAGALLVLLLAGLAVLQLTWLREVAAADRQRLEAAVEAALGAFTGEVDREVSRAWLAFRPFGPEDPDRAALAALWERWRDTAPYPELVADLYLLERAAPGAEPAALRLVGGERWEPVSSPLHGASWWDGAAQHQPHRRPRHRELHLAAFSPLRAELPGLLLPLPAGWHSEAPGRALLVVFDRGFLAGELLPRLASRHLEPVLGGDLELRVSVAGSGEELFATRPGLRGGFDWQAPLFDLLPPEDLHRLFFASRRLDDELATLRVRRQRGGAGVVDAGELERGPRRRMAPPRRPSAPAAGWQVALRPGAGSLDAALARAHAGNAALALGILLLIALAAAALAQSARRARALANRQLEFTAAVSHELRTPLAAIRSLAENLADGVIADPAQARCYGAQIARQGERLSAMVEQVLVLAADPTQAPAFERRPLALAPLLREAAEEAAAGFPGAHLETDLAPDLPVLEGDAAALRRAVSNLLTNAFRHGGDPPWASLAARRDPLRDEVRVAVADRGPGVPDGDRERLFEPFYRGQRARAAQVPGAGLGLHLARRAAEAHGGRLELSATSGTGSTFTLVLPVATTAEAPR